MPHTPAVPTRLLTPEWRSSEAYEAAYPEFALRHTQTNKAAHLASAAAQDRRRIAYGRWLLFTVTALDAAAAGHHEAPRHHSRNSSATTTTTTTTTAAASSTTAAAASSTPATSPDSMGPLPYLTWQEPSDSLLHYGYGGEPSDAEAEPRPVRDYLLVRPSKQKVKGRVPRLRQPKMEGYPPRAEPVAFSCRQERDRLAAARRLVERAEGRECSPDDDPAELELLRAAVRNTVDLAAGLGDMSLGEGQTTEAPVDAEEDVETETEMEEEERGRKRAREAEPAEVELGRGKRRKVRRVIN